MGITVLRGSLSIHSTVDSRCKFTQYRGLGRPDKVIACEVSIAEQASTSVSLFFFRRSMRPDTGFLLAAGLLAAGIFLACELRADKILT